MARSDTKLFLIDSQVMLTTSDCTREPRLVSHSRFGVLALTHTHTHFSVRPALPPGFNWLVGNYSGRLVSGEVSTSVPGPLHLRAITPMVDSLLSPTVSPSLSVSRQSASSLISFSDSLVFSYNSLTRPFQSSMMFPRSFDRSFYSLSSQVVWSCLSPSLQDWESS